MKVVVPVFGFNVSGGVRLLAGMANGLVARGHEVTFAVASRDCNSPFPLEPQVKVRKLHTRAPGRYLERACNAALLGARLPRCDVVLANAFLTAYPAYAAVRLGRAKVAAYYALHYEPLVMGVLSERGAVARKLAAAAASFTYRLPLDKLTLSQWISDQLRQHHAADSVVVPPFIEHSFFRPSNVARDEDAILTVGREARWKGIADLVQALRIVRRQVPRVRLVVATREALDLPDDMPIDMINPMSDHELSRLYATCGLFAFPSWYEGFGLPPLEAMACGAPVVLTDSGGVRDFAQDGENCVVVPPRSPKALASAIIRLLEDRPLRERVAAAGVKTASEYTLDRTISILENLLLSLLARAT